MHLMFATIFGVENWMLILVVALLLFGGRKLPEMGRGLAQGISEFKKGLRGIEDDIDQSGNSTPPSILPDQRTTKAALPSGYRFDPYTGKPLAEASEPPKRFDPYTGKPLDVASEPAGSRSGDSSNG